MTVHPDDLAMARRAAVEGKRLAAALERNWVARMDPRPIPWGKSAELAEAVKTLAYHVAWLSNAVGRHISGDDQS